MLNKLTDACQQSKHYRCVRSFHGFRADDRTIYILRNPIARKTLFWWPGTSWSKIEGASFAMQPTEWARKQSSHRFRGFANLFSDGKHKIVYRLTTHSQKLWRARAAEPSVPRVEAKCHRGETSTQHISGSQQFANMMSHGTSSQIRMNLLSRVQRGNELQLSRDFHQMELPRQTAWWSARLSESWWVWYEL